jgi:uncharacterized protein YbaP (TraB family)
MQIKRTLISFLFLILFVEFAAAQQQYPATLLWRINGKNLTQPSYLYGTMHVQDRRLFYFGDSLYHALEQTESFAMELNPDDMMDSLFKSMERKDTSVLIKKMLGDKEYKRVSKRLEKQLKIPADQITIKKLADNKRNLTYKAKRNDDMSTAMDMYLYTIAHRQGKITTGIEDVSDQLNILDELGSLNIKDLILDDSVQQMDNLEKMKQIYIKRDLTGLNKMVNGINSNFDRDLLLIKRNAKMAIRIDSLLRLRSVFFAIGAAHLPGDSGVIHLLEQEGFTLSPVMASAYIAPEDYKYTAKEFEWKKVEDEHKTYSIYMPGTPSEVVAEKILPMKIYVDLSDISYYASGVTTVGESNAKSDSFFIKIIDRYKKLGFDVKSTKNITYKEASGIEMYADQGGENHFRFRMLEKGDRLFIVIFGAGKQENLSGANAEKFLNSLTIADQFSGGTKSWHQFSNEKNAFTMQVPAKTQMDTEVQEGIPVDKYFAIDYTDGSYYSVTANDTRPGYYLQNDSTVFEEYKKRLDESTKNGVKEFSIGTFKNFPACHFVAYRNEGGTDYSLQGYMVHRGNRTYLVMVAGLKEKAAFPAVTNFFRQFEFTPFKESGWGKQRCPDNTFLTMAPTHFKAFEKDSTDTDADSKMKKYFAADKNTGVAYSIEVEPISPYYWTTSDSAFFKNRANSFKGDNDSLISYAFHNDAVKNADVLIKLSDAKIYKRLKVFLNGDTLYTLFSFQNEEVLHSDYFGKFFSDAGFSATYTPTIFNNKAAVLFQALQSKDSAVSATANAALKKAVFSKQDLPLLYAAFTKKYLANTDEDYDINTLLADKIIEVNDSNVVDFVNGHYEMQNDSSANVQMEMLRLLAANKTKQSYALLRNLLINNTPRQRLSYNLIYRLTDSIALIKDFFPAAVKLYGDTIVGGSIAKIANKLLDSNAVKSENILQNEKGLYALANRQWLLLKNDAEEYPDNNDAVIDLLGRFNTKEGNGILNRYSKLSDMWVKNKAILALLKNNQPVNPSEILKFAGDNEWRTDFYNSLNDIHKTNLFPKAYYAQQKFAESYLYNSLNSDYDVIVKSMQLIKTKTAMVDGKLKRYYIYKVLLDDEEDASPRLAFCGAFDNNISIVTIKDADLDIYFNYDEKFSASKIDESFKKYIAEKQNTKTVPSIQ